MRSTLVTIMSNEVYRGEESDRKVEGPSKGYWGRWVGGCGGFLEHTTRSVLQHVEDVVSPSR